MVASIVHSTGDGNTTNGALDPNWTYSNALGQTGQAAILGTGSPGFYPIWPSDNSTRSWISDPVEAMSPNSGGLPLSFSTTFDLTGFDPRTMSLTLGWGIDDSGYLLLNGKQVATSPFIGPVPPNDGEKANWFPDTNTVTLTSGFLPRLNTLTISLANSDNYYEGAVLQVESEKVQSMTAPVVTDTTPNHFRLVPEPPGSSFNPLANVSDTDALNTQQTIRVSLAAAGGTALGTLADTTGTLTLIGGNLYSEPVTLAGLGDGTALLHRLIYTPPALNPGQSEQINLKAAVSNSSGSNATPTFIYDIDTAPLIGGIVANQPDNVGQTINPFSTVTVTDTDYQTVSSTPGTMDTATITLDPSETTIFTGTDLSAVSGNPGKYTLAAATPAALQTELRGLAFDPSVNDNGKTIAINLAVTDVAANLTSNATASVVVPPAPAPKITNIMTPQMVASGSTISVFSGVSVSDVQLNATDTVTIQILDSTNKPTDANGTFNPTTAFQKTGVGTYTSTSAMDPNTLTNALTALVFNPTPDVGVNPVISTIQLSVTDTGNKLTTNALPIALKEIPQKAGAPTITGIDPAQMIAASVTPFSGVTVADPATGAMDTVSIIVSGQNGQPTDANGTFNQPPSGPTLKETSSGVFTFTTPLTPSALTTALDALTFATKGTANTTIQLSVTDPGDNQTTNAQQITLSQNPTGGGGPSPGGTNGSGSYLVTDKTTGQTTTATGTPYSGPVAGLTSQFIDVTQDKLNITAQTPNSFIKSGSGDDAIDVSKVNGTNVMDGFTGSNFLVGGTGIDQFFVDDRHASADIWSTMANFHSGDTATVWGITQAGFGINWVGGQGATGFTGLTLHVTANNGAPTASLTLPGFTTADLNNGRFNISFGTTPNLPNLPGSDYMLIAAT